MFNYFSVFQQPVSVDYNCTVKDCNVTANIEDGIDVRGNNCLIAGNTCSGNLQFGISIIGSQNRIDGNVCNNSGFGIYPTNPNVGNIIIRNSAGGAAGYYNPSGNNNDYAPILTPSTASPNPWSNF
jgi:parallel beta-helix repeat protein